MFEPKNKRTRGLGKVVDALKQKIGLNACYYGRKGSILFTTVILMTFMIAVASAVFYTTNSQRDEQKVNLSDQQVYQEAVTLSDLICSYLDAFVETSGNGKPSYNSLPGIMLRMLPGERLDSDKQYFIDKFMNGTDEEESPLKDFVGKYSISILCVDIGVQKNGVAVTYASKFEITTEVENRTSSQKFTRRYQLANEQTFEVTGTTAMGDLYIALNWNTRNYGETATGVPLASPTERNVPVASLSGTYYMDDAKTIPIDSTMASLPYDVEILYTPTTNVTFLQEGSAFDAIAGTAYNVDNPADEKYFAGTQNNQIIKYWVRVTLTEDIYDALGDIIPKGTQEIKSYTIRPGAVAATKFNLATDVDVFFRDSGGRTQYNGGDKASTNWEMDLTAGGCYAPWTKDVAPTIGTLTPTYDTWFGVALKSWTGTKDLTGFETVQLYDETYTTSITIGSYVSNIKNVSYGELSGFIFLDTRDFIFNYNSILDTPRNGPATVTFYIQAAPYTPSVAPAAGYTYSGGNSGSGIYVSNGDDRDLADSTDGTASKWFEGKTQATFKIKLSGGGTVDDGTVSYGSGTGNLLVNSLGGSSKVSDGYKKGASLFPNGLNQTTPESGAIYFDGPVYSGQYWNNTVGSYVGSKNGNFIWTRNDGYFGINTPVEIYANGDVTINIPSASFVYGGIIYANGNVNITVTTGNYNWGDGGGYPTISPSPELKIYASGTINFTGNNKIIVTKYPNLGAETSGSELDNMLKKKLPVYSDPNKLPPVDASELTKAGHDGSGNFSLAMGGVVEKALDFDKTGKPYPYDTITESCYVSSVAEAGAMRVLFVDNGSSDIVVYLGISSFGENTNVIVNGTGNVFFVFMNNFEIGRGNMVTPASFIETLWSYDDGDAYINNKTVGVALADALSKKGSYNNRTAYEIYLSGYSESTLIAWKNLYFHTGTNAYRTGTYGALPINKEQLYASNRYTIAFRKSNQAFMSGSIYLPVIETFDLVDKLYNSGGTNNNIFFWDGTAAKGGTKKLTFTGAFVVANIKSGSVQSYVTEYTGALVGNYNVTDDSNWGFQGSGWFTHVTSSKNPPPSVQDFDGDFPNETAGTIPSPAEPSSDEPSKSIVPPKTSTSEGTTYYQDDNEIL